MKCTQEKCPIKDIIGNVKHCTAHNCKYRTLPQNPASVPGCHNANPNGNHEHNDVPSNGVKNNQCSR